jgi:hypothetical protein
MSKSKHISKTKQLTLIFTFCNSNSNHVITHILLLNFSKKCKKIGKYKLIRNRNSQRQHVDFTFHLGIIIFSSKYYLAVSCLE